MSPRDREEFVARIIVEYGRKGLRPTFGRFGIQAMRIQVRHSIDDHEPPLVWTTNMGAVDDRACCPLGVLLAGTEVDQDDTVWHAIERLLGWYHMDTVHFVEGVDGCEPMSEDWEAVAATDLGLMVRRALSP